MVEQNTQQIAVASPKGFKLFMMTIRAFAFPASVIPILYGSMISVVMNRNTPGFHFDFLVFFLTLIGAMCIHVTTNVVNDIYDYDKGLDKEDKEIGIPHGGSLVLSRGLVSNAQLKLIAFLSAIIALAIGFFLYVHTGYNKVILGLIIFGFLSAIYYTAAPFSLKYKALGDIQVFLSFGTGMTLGAYLVQTHTFSWIPVILSIPFGLLIDAILHSNNIRDINFDGKFGVKTLPILIGEQLSKYFYYFLILSAYASIIFFVAFGIIPWPALLNLITLPTALKLIRMLKDIPKDNIARWELGTKHNIMTAQFNMQFGLTLVAGLIISLFF